MSGTMAVPLDMLSDADRTSLTGQPLCPACHTGHLHPFKVEVRLTNNPNGFEGADFLTGWVVICQGNADYNRAMAKMYEEMGKEPGEVFEHPPCGFSMPMQAHRWNGHGQPAVTL